MRKIIFSSTGGALYGEPDVVPADEGHPIRPLSPYGTSKYSFEQYLGMFERTFGLRYTKIPCTVLYADSRFQQESIGHFERQVIEDGIDDNRDFLWTAAKLG